MKSSFDITASARADKLPVAPDASGAQREGPPPPAQYRAEIRYRINASRAGRLTQYFPMLRYFESLGFRRDPGAETEPEDPAETRLTGTIPSTAARRLLEEPHVQAILLLPTEYQIPDAPEALVKVRLELTENLAPDRQGVFAEQTVERLAALGFREAVGYDHRGHTRIVGWIPAGELESLLEDLRFQPSGWLAPVVPLRDVPPPLRNQAPIRVIEVTPEPKDFPPARETAAPEAPAPEDALSKVSGELRRIAEADDAAKSVRMEIVLVTPPAPGDESWKRLLARTAPGLAIEGRIGALLAVLAPANAVRALAESPQVATVRLPQAAWLAAAAVVDPPKANDLLRATGLDQLHARGFRGRGVRIAIINTDFRGYRELIGHGLPATTRYVDLTAERNPSLEADPFAGSAETIGSGTNSARIAALAAPEAEFTLIRVDAAAPYQIEMAARFLRGGPLRSLALDLRADEILAENDRLGKLRQDFARDREAFLDSLGPVTDPERRRELLLKPTEEVEKEIAARRQALDKREADLLAQEAEYRRRERRYLDQLDKYRALKGIQIVSSGLVWNEGYPLAGNGPLSRFFNALPRSLPLWFQAVGETRGQTWAGLFRDLDGNGVMEFAPPGVPLRPSKWTSELNFLAWQPASGTPTPELPAKAIVRLSLQWREPHDPSFLRAGEDVYRRPLADLRLVVLHQRDPTGKRLPTDDLEVVARSAGLPLRLDNEPEAATYQITVDFPVDPAGRYAVRLEGRVPPSIRPAIVPSLPGQVIGWELWSRLFVETRDAASRRQGRPVFLDYFTNAGSIGMPADARSVIAVGTADASGRAEPSSTAGSPLNSGLLAKPDVLVPGSVAPTPFAAGAAAAWLSSGVPPAQIDRRLHAQPGQTLRLQ